jgi:hypothetical protein
VIQFRLTEKVLPEFPGGMFVAHSDPDGSGGRFAEFYHLDQLLESAGLKLAERSSKCTQSSIFWHWEPVNSQCQIFLVTFV